MVLKQHHAVIGLTVKISLIFNKFFRNKSKRDFSVI